MLWTIVLMSFDDLTFLGIVDLIWPSQAACVVFILLGLFVFQQR